MSRLGRKPIKIPAGVEVKFRDSSIQVKGKLGTLEYRFPAGVSGAIEGEILRLKGDVSTPAARAQYGLARATVNNLVAGVNTGFTRVLELSGPGYKAAASGSMLTLVLGYSNPVEFKLDKSIQVTIKGNQITLTGMDKAKVGEAASEIRHLREVEPYKERGIKYAGEKVRRKVSKAAKV